MHPGIQIGLESVTRQHTAAVCGDPWHLNPSKPRIGFFPSTQKGDEAYCDGAERTQHSEFVWTSGTHRALILNRNDSRRIQSCRSVQFYKNSSGRTCGGVGSISEGQNAELRSVPRTRPTGTRKQSARNTDTAIWSYCGHQGMLTGKIWIQICGRSTPVHMALTCFAQS